MSRFIVFAGPNGSGKSSVRDAIVNPAEVVIDPDRIAREINPENTESANNAAGRMAVRLFDESLAASRSISMETTLTGHSAVQRMERAKAVGYEVSLVYVALDDPELNVRRVAARVRSGGHAIDPDVVRKRVGSSLDNLPRALAIADQAIVLDNSGLTHRRVLEVADGRVTYLAESLPDWLKQLMPAIGAALLRNVVAPTPERSRPTPSRDRGLVTPLLDALRTAEPTAAPGQPPAVPMAERIRAFEKQASADNAKQNARPEPSPEAKSDAPKPRGPRP